MSDLIQKIKKIVKDKLYEEYPQKYHHSLRVADIVKGIAQSESYENSVVLEVAALMHDISPNQSSNVENAIPSAALAKKLLNGLLSAEDVLIIEKAILATEKKVLDDSSKEEAILHDANILDLLGMTGILRVAYNMGKENDHDSVDDLPVWFEDYSQKNLSLLKLEYSRKLGLQKFSEIKKSGK